MSTLRISNIEAKADSSSPTVDEQLRFTNSDGDLMLYLDGRTAGITTVGINTTNQTIKFDANNNVMVTGIITATEFHGTLAVGTSVTYGDNEKAYFGTGLDLELFHNGSNSYIKNDTGWLNLLSDTIFLGNKADTKAYLKGYNGGSVEIFYNHSKKFETTNTGVTITGNATATTFIGALTGTASGNPTLASGSNNRIITATGANALTGESTLTYDNPNLEINTDTSAYASFILNGNTGGMIMFEDNETSKWEMFGATDFSIYDRANTNQPFTIKSGGSIGINNTNPQEKLQITGNISFGNRSDGASRYIGKGTNGSGGVIGDASANANSCWIGFVSGSGTGAEDQLRFGTLKSGTSGGERMRITGTGEVGINETSPDRKLHVRSDGAAAAKLGGESGAAYYMEIGQLASSGSPGFNATGSSTSMLFQLNGSEKVRIDSSGRLLVANNSAGEADSSADDLVIGNTGQGNNGMTIVTNNANNGALFFADQDGGVRGGFRYQHSVDVLQCYAGGSVSLQIKSNAIGLHENYPVANSLTIRGAATDDTPSLVLKRHTDGVQGDGEVIGRIQFMSNENNVDSGNHHTRAEIRAETQSTSGASRLEFYTVPNSTIATSLAATINGTQDFMIGTQNPDEGGAGLGFNARGFVYRPSGHAVVRSASTSVSGASGICYTAKFADTGTGKAFRVMLAQTEIGSIGMGAGGTTFNTSSDYRRKENIINLTGAITRLKTLTPRRFNFKDEPSVTRDGFLAHEVTAVPEAITGTKDQVDSNNDPVYQQMDQSKLVPLLVAALQEAVARIEALEGS